MTAHGIGLVARQEIRTRLRTGRWKILLAAWFLAVNGLGLLFRVALEYGDTSSYGEPGVPMFGGVLLGVLVLTLLVTPALGGQSVNGDRERGTLATLQVTRLTPVEIALGKLAAAWGTGLVTLLLTLPSLLLPVAEGAIGAGRAFVVLLVTALMIGVVCAVSQAWSAVLARSVTSILLSYLTVFGLLVGTPLLFTLAVPLTSEHVDGSYGGYSREHTERIWWLLAPNPVVALADAAPRLPERRIFVGDQVITRSASSDPLGQISRGVREIRAGDDDRYGSSRSDGAAVWPWGLAFDLALAGGAVAVTASRLRTPLHRVPRGVRVA
ncbi:ABC transporter permease [Actinomadura citrea]|jgi:ABC-type transport system involved in multi-copper enzyme maturation permease subunit|uniref:ABC-type transport system involved in multi-copper enzyme maturation permease subunit n=1 Tax=Actinomadura citrea TaxID=46158 RepID=A0A7Y9KIZ7_9ACTN|nr:ABC transporter permease [Actinomadura citrea]NYE17259.1 ABC-type transport system involved in multi-copper enzyme maturation permease subunit [Actinomadura citrea]GGT92793.1 ABC transporter permease [Actinomadura citrea]